MKRYIHGLAAALALAAVGCASVPDGATVPPATASCAALGAEATRLAEAKRVAVGKEQGAWKAVVPFAVFVTLHAPSWGVAHLLFVSMAAVAFTIAFMWRGDLWTNIVGHLAVDAVPLIVLPLMGTPHG